jgi:serine/threonine protein kinase
VVKLADFGFAKRVSELEAREISLGTPAYVAPEIIRGDPYGVEVDIWSLGVVSYILLCGCPPFQEESSRIFDQIQAGAYDFHEEHWSRVSPSAVDFISRMLTVSQRDRWTAQHLLSHPWLCCSYPEHHQHMHPHLHQHATFAPPLPSLDICLAHLRRFTARRKLRAIAQVVVVTNRMRKVLRSSSSERGSEALKRYQETHRAPDKSPPGAGKALSE